MYKALNDPFKISNLFPPDISPAEKFLLLLLHLSGPISNTGIRMVLKPLVCDDNVPKIIQKLLENGYLHARDTDQGKFYALTPRTAAYIDYKGITPVHRRQSIADKMLLTYRLQSYVMAQKLVRTALSLYLSAWDKLAAEEKQQYLAERYTQYNLKDTIDFSAFQEFIVKELHPNRFRALDLLPRTLVKQEEVIQAMTDQIQAGNVTFTEHYNKAIYTDYNDPFVKLLNAYDAAQVQKQSLSAKLHGLKVKIDTDPAAAEEYRKVFIERENVNHSIKDLASKTALPTHHHKAKILSLRILEQNGIFIRGYRSDMLYFGLLNNYTCGLPSHILDMRIDYIVTLAERLGKTPHITVYSLPSDTALTANRVYALAAHRKPSSTYTMPKIAFKTISVSVKDKYEIWHSVISSMK